MCGPREDKEERHAEQRRSAPKRGETHIDTETRRAGKVCTQDPQQCVPSALLVTTPAPLAPHRQPQSLLSYSCAAPTRCDAAGRACVLKTCAGRAEDMAASQS
jgi:hypothetical protein